MATTGRSRLLIGLVVLAAAAGLFFGVRALSSSSSPAAAPSPTASAEPREPKVVQPRPFKVRIRSVRGEVLDSSNMYGRRPDVRVKNIRLSTRRAARALERYLNTQFVARKTRQSRGPMRALLSGEAQRQLTPRDRKALGLGGPRIAGGRSIAANATAVALYEGTQAYAVTLRYTARMNVDLASGKAKRLSQSGVMVLRPTRAGPWRADMVDVSLTWRPAPQKKRNPAPTGSEAGTP